MEKAKSLSALSYFVDWPQSPLDFRERKKVERERKAFSVESIGNNRKHLHKQSFSHCHTTQQQQRAISGSQDMAKVASVLLLRRVTVAK